jgi:hypothetical protein
MFVFRAAVLFLSLTIGGCADLTITSRSIDAGIDGVACVGSVAASVAGMSESSNAALLNKAQFQTGKGGVCSAKVFSVTEPVVLYRVFDSNNPYSKFGGWWTLKRPAGSRDDYRAANAICKEWSNLDRLISCELRPGSQVVVGTTQSAVCDDGTTYPKTAENQVYVPNDGRAGIVHVGACSEGVGWP